MAKLRIALCWLSSPRLALCEKSLPHSSPEVSLVCLFFHYTLCVLTYFFLVLVIIIYHYLSHWNLSSTSHISRTVLAQRRHLISWTNKSVHSHKCESWWHSPKENHLFRGQNVDVCTLFTRKKIQFRDIPSLEEFTKITTKWKKKIIIWFQKKAPKSKEFLISSDRSVKKSFMGVPTCSPEVQDCVTRVQ